METLVGAFVFVALFIGVGMVLLRRDSRSPEALDGSESVKRLSAVITAGVGAGVLGLTAAWVLQLRSEMCADARYCFAPGVTEAVLAGCLVVPSAIAACRVASNLLGKDGHRTSRFDVFLLAVGIGLAAATLLLAPRWFAVFRANSVEWSPMTSRGVTNHDYAAVVAIERSSKTIAPAGKVLHEATFRVRFRDGDALVLWNLPGDGGPGRFEEAAAWLARQTGVDVTNVDLIDLGE